jgi:hypothetical protein
MEKLPYRLNKEQQLYLIFTVLVSLTIMNIAEYLRWLNWDFDDAMIVYRMVHNLQNHGLWAFNINETHNPSTSVLNPILINFFTYFIPYIPQAAHLLDTICIAICALITLMLMWELSYLGSILAGHLVVFILAYDSTWGLEVKLLIALILLFVLNESQIIKSKQGKINADRLIFKQSVSWFLLGLAVLARPDAMILVALKLMAIAYSYFKNIYPVKPQAVDNITIIIKQLGAMIPLAVVVFPWLIYSYQNFGSFFPDTLSNKMWQGHSGFWGRYPVYLRGWWHYLLDMSWLLKASYLLAPIGVWLTIFKRPALLYFVAYCLIHQSAYTILNVPGYHWYFATANVCAVLLASVFVCTAIESIAMTRIWKHVTLTTVPLILLGMSIYNLLSASTDIRLDVRNESYKQAAYRIQDLINNEPNVATNNPKDVDNVKLAVQPNTIASGATYDENSMHDTIAALEVGTLGYYTINNRVIDLIGLASENPEYISKENIDHFFDQPPRIVILHQPLWHFEKALADDIRFKILYSKGVSLENGAVPLQYFLLKQNADLSSQQAIKDYLLENFSGMVAEDRLTSSPITASPEALCVIDIINGQLHPDVTTKTSYTLSISGWAVVPKAQNPESDAVRLLLIDDQAIPVYSAQLNRTSRPDVGEHIQRPELDRLGIESNTHLLNIEKGSYRLAIQFEKNEVCLTNHSIVTE